MSQSFVNDNNVTPGTGTGLIVGQDQPTINQPVITGVTDGSNASAGDVGEIISQEVPISSEVSLTDGVEANVTSIALSSGDWNIWANVFFNGSTNNMNTVFCQSNVVSATIGDGDEFNRIDQGPYLQIGMSTPFRRVSVSSNQTVYLVARANFSSGSAGACGEIFARRVR